MIYLAYDIETARNENAQKTIDMMDFKAPSNWKDEKKIEEYIAGERQKAFNKAGLKWWTGKIISISAVVVGDSKEYINLAGDDERRLLCDWFDYVSGLVQKFGDVVPVGKSSKDFDFPFIIGRAMAHDIGLIPLFQKERNLQDIDLIFGWSSSAGQRSNLDNYAFGLDIEGKTKHGNAVQGLYDIATGADTQDEREQAWCEISDYNEQDAHIVATIVQRYNKRYEPMIQQPNPPLPLEDSEVPFN